MHGVAKIPYQLHLVKSKILAFPEKDVLALKICSVFDEANTTREEIGVGWIQLLCSQVPMFEFRISLGSNLQDLLISSDKQTPESSEWVKVIYIEAKKHISCKIYKVYHPSSNNNIYNNTYAQKIYIVQIYFKTKYR